MKKGLGRGFDTLIPTDLIDDFDPTTPEDKQVSQLKEIKISEIQRNEEQPRRHFDEQALSELADSIKKHGIVQPLVITPVKGAKAKYQIVAGERRWRAAKEAGLKTVPAIIRSLSDQNRLELAIVENAQRENLCAIELAAAYAKLKSQFNMTEAEIAKRVGKNKISVINTLRLLNLPDYAKQAMLEHHLKEATMRPLIKADDALVKKVLPHIVDEGWSARKVDQYVNAHQKKSSTRIVRKSLYARDERSLTKRYKTEVIIQGHSLRFVCKDDDELHKLIKVLSGQAE